MRGVINERNPLFPYFDGSKLATPNFVSDKNHGYQFDQLQSVVQTK